TCAHSRPEHLPKYTAGLRDGPRARRSPGRSSASLEHPKHQRRQSAWSHSSRPDCFGLLGYWAARKRICASGRRAATPIKRAKAHLPRARFEWPGWRGHIRQTLLFFWRRSQGRELGEEERLPLLPGNRERCALVFSAIRRDFSPEKCPSQTMTLK